MEVVMKLGVSRTDVWAATIEDRPGGLADRLSPLAGAGANLEFIISRRTPERQGQGVVFVTPLKGSKQTKAAEQAGFQRTDTLHSVRVEGTDKPGLGAQLTQALATAGVNLRGFSAAAFGRRFVCYLALDSAEEAAKAAGVLKKMK
jgi:hypothetical protein